MSDQPSNQHYAPSTGYQQGASYGQQPTGRGRGGFRGAYQPNQRGRGRGRGHGRGRGRGGHHKPYFADRSNVDTSLPLDDSPDALQTRFGAYYSPSFTQDPWTAPE